MMRNSPLKSMQKTYDECYLICSTAVFFEGQNNEAEALRSWRSALSQIHYHNANKLPSGWSPKSETERALWQALKQMEDQCKERVDLLKALKESREDTGQSEPPTNLSKLSLVNNTSSSSLWLGEGTIPPAQYTDIPGSSAPPLPRRTSGSSVLTLEQTSLGVPPKLPVPATKKSRSPSPDQRRPMRTTLRPERKGFGGRNKSQPAAKPATMKAAGLAWNTQLQAPRSKSAFEIEADPTIEARLSAQAARRSFDAPRPHETRADSVVTMPDLSDYQSASLAARAGQASYEPTQSSYDMRKRSYNQPASNVTTDPEKAFPSPLQVKDQKEPPPPPPPHRIKPAEIRYRKEAFPSASNVPEPVAKRILDNAYKQPDPAPKPAGLTRKPVAASPKARPPIPQARNFSYEDDQVQSTPKPRRPRPKTERSHDSGTITPPSTDSDLGDEETPEAENEKDDFDHRAEALLANLPKGIDLFAAKQVLNEVIIKGDEVHWDDVAGLHTAKKALKEAVVYPFLRPDLFMGLREPARGMLLFGPPGTGKTMLARAVATESRSTFFSITASSLASKWHGESEKLVRALFGMAKALAPSIIFVDEIDSLLNSRGGNSEHEASRRSKTEFLIQWSDLQRAAAGKDASNSAGGDPTRVLVLAATNCPWDIDEAARRRFVRRQYIPLPEPETRETQLRTLLKSQKHSLGERDVLSLTKLTEGYSGSDITALCKDAAMQPLRNLGEALLTTPIDQIRPICLDDFKASLASIRPSVGKKGLEQFEEWAREYGERGA